MIVLDVVFWCLLVALALVGGYTYYVLITGKNPLLETLSADDDKYEVG